MPGIAVDNLVKEWGGVRAVDQVSFETGEAEFVALLGPSGCGKSTTLRLIAGLETADTGRIAIAGREVTHLPASKRNLSMVFQSYALFPHLTVAENIVFGLSIRGVAKASRNDPPAGDRQAPEPRPISSTGGRASCRAGSSSASPSGARSSPRRRCACSTSPCPISMHSCVPRCAARSARCSGASRMTMLFVTHDQTEAMSMADRIILMRAGKVEQCGAPFDLYEKPASTFVARFIGTPPMNVIEIDPGPVPAGDASLVASPGAAGAPDRHPARGHPLSRIRGLRAIVGSTEYFGADSVTTCRVGDQSLLVRTPGGPGSRRAAPFTSAGRRRPPIYFDKTSGLRCEPPRNELRQRNA